MEIIEIQNEIVDEFNMFDSWMEKYEYLIDLGKNIPKISNENKTDDNIIKGCQSKVWLHALEDNGKINFFADSDAIITKGIIALLIRVLNNQLPSEIMKTKLEFINIIGLTNHLSPTRANGLLEMVKQMKNYAYALSLSKN